jgi:hypothetical protein
MALGSHEPKKRTMAEVIAEAAEQDERRQAQIRNQTTIINRLLEVNQTYEAALEEITKNTAPGSRQGNINIAREALDNAAEINKKHRKRSGEANGS